MGVPKAISVQSNIVFVIEATIGRFRDHDTLQGLKIIEEPLSLRHYQTGFTEI